MSIETKLPMSILKKLDVQEVTELMEWKLNAVMEALDNQTLLFFGGEDGRESN